MSLEKEKRRRIATVTIKNSREWKIQITPYLYDSKKVNRKHTHLKSVDCARHAAAFSFDLRARGRGGGHLFHYIYPD